MSKTKEQKQLRKAYKKMMKAHKKQILKAAKDASENPFEFEQGLMMLIEHLKFMRDYYALGYNVMAQEIEGVRPRLEGIEAALEEYDLGFDLECNSVIDYKYFEKKDYSLPFNQKLGTFVLPDFDAPKNGLTFKEAFAAAEEEKKEHKRKFYDILFNEACSWWD